MDATNEQFILKAKAMDPNTTAEELESIYEKANYDTQLALASNPSASRDLLMRMLKDATQDEYLSPDLVLEIVNNKNFPLDVLFDIDVTKIPSLQLNDKDERYEKVSRLLDRIILELDRPNPPINLITETIRYEDGGLDYTKVYGVDKKIAKEIIAKRNIAVKKAKALFDKYRTDRESELGLGVVNENDDRVLYSSKEADIASNPNTSIEELRELGLNSKNPYIRRLVASNRNITSELISEMMEKINYEDDGFSFVPFELILNPNCPSDKLFEYLDRTQQVCSINWKIGNLYWKKCWNKISRELDKTDCPIKLVEDVINWEKPNNRSVFGSNLNNKNNKKVYETIINKAKKIYKNPERRNRLSVRTVEDREYDKEKALIAELKQKDYDLKQREETELKRKELIEEKKEKLKSLLSELKELNEAISLSEYQDTSKVDYSTKTQIPESALIITVGEHREINPEYIPFLAYIDLSMLDSTNLKVSGIDWSNTNISIDPQKVFMKDLSYSKFSDENIVFKSFDECNLSGTDISDEKDSTITENIIVDENTKLPETNKRAV